MTKTNTKLTRKSNAKAAPAAKAPAKRQPAARKPAANGDAIKTVVGTRTGNGTFVEAGNGKHVVISDWQNNAKTQKLARVGASMAELVAHLSTIPKPAAKLAKGVEGKMTENSRKAVADNAKAASSRSGRKARGDSAAVAGKPAKAAKQRSGNGRGHDAAQKLTVLVKPKDSGLAAGSGRMAKLEFAVKCKTVGAFLGQTVKDASGKEHKCDAGALSGMLKRGHVRLG